jgi:hypothetical protein
MVTYEPAVTDGNLIIALGATPLEFATKYYYELMSSIQ